MMSDEWRSIKNRLRDTDQPLFHEGDIVVSNRSDSGEMTVTGIRRDQKGFIYELGKITRREENLWLCYSQYDHGIYIGKNPKAKYVNERIRGTDCGLILCPFCKRIHIHGKGDGHRIKHCSWPFRGSDYAHGYELEGIAQ